MTNATETTKSEQAARGPRSVTFVSRSPNFTIFLDSGKAVPGPNGQVEYKGRITIRFTNNTFSTNDPEIIEKMRRCKSYRKQFQEVNEPARAKSSAA